MTDSEILAFLSDSGYIDLDIIRMRVKEMERKKFLDMHSNKIWQSASGYWYTELPPTENDPKRKLLKKKNRIDLDNSIIEFYERQLSQIATFKSCFDDWLARKIKYKEIALGTAERYQCDYNRFIRDSELEYRPMDLISEEELEDFIRDEILDKNLTAKAYGNMRTILLGTFKYAKKKKYTNMSISSFFADMDISAKSFKRTKKMVTVFNDDETQKITSYLRDNPNIVNLGLLLTFETGIRTAELAGLKFEDWKGDWLYIQRQEIRYKEKGQRGYIYEVVDYTKTEAGERKIALPQSAQVTLRRIRELNPNGEYIMQDGERKYKKLTFNDRLYLACDACGIPRKSMHKIRKTYGSILLDAGVDDIVTLRQMGHANIETTRKYYYGSTKNDQRYLEQIREAITV